MRQGQSRGKKKGQRDSIEDVEQYYRNNSEDMRLQIQQLEYHVTSRLLLKYLDSPRHVLEVGAGPGHYTTQLALQGHQVTSIELVSDLTEHSRQRLKQYGAEDKVTLLTGDARDLVDHIEGPIDAALVMGPLYHLVAAGERKKLMKSIVQRVRSKGLIITTHLTRIGLLGYMMTRLPAWVMGSPEQVDEILTSGHLRNHPRNGDFRAHFATVNEIKSFHESLDLKVIALHSQDPCIGSLDEIFNNLPHDLKNHWAEVLTSVSHEPDALGSGRSLFCVSRV